MDREPLISMIVPVYNVMSYLEDCFSSIISQTYSNLEIIIVDDGSTDGSSDICDRYAGMDGRIRVIHQENQGAARARKKAVMCATGIYTGFVDADDKISPDMVAYMAAHIGNCDLATVGCYCEEVPGRYIEQTDTIREGIYASEGEMNFFHANMLAYRGRFEYGILPYLVNKLFKTAMLQNLIDGIHSTLSYAEDAEVVYQYLLQCKAVCVTHQCLYYYRYRADSALHKVDKHYMCHLNEVYLALEKAFAQHPQSEALIRQLQVFVTQHVYAITDRMGFPDATGTLTYGFPYSDMKKNKRIVLYGAGKVGMSYYRQIFLQKQMNLVLWVDKNWKEYEERYMPVSNPKKIREYEYDYLIIAVKTRKLADEISLELTNQGIDTDKILWRAPAVW